MADYFAFWRHYADFKGKTTRRGFWIAIVLWAVVSFVLNMTLSVMFLFILNMEPEQAVNFARIAVSDCYGLPSVVPLMAITVRRLRDGGYSPKSFCWLLVPVLGGFAFIARLLASSKQETI